MKINATKDCRSIKAGEEYEIRAFYKNETLAVRNLKTHEVVEGVPIEAFGLTKQEVTDLIDAGTLKRKSDANEITP